jgi:hypothetical protein
MLKTYPPRERQAFWARQAAIWLRSEPHKHSALGRVVQMDDALTVARLYEHERSRRCTARSFRDT